MMSWLDIDKEIIKNTDFVYFFEDNFGYSPKISKSFDHLSDSKDYIKCLEKKLEKIKGTNSKVQQSKDLIKSLSNVRQDAIRNLLTDESSANQLDDNQSETVATNYLEKKMHPERQALSAEELDMLLKADYLAKRTQQ